MIELKRVSSTKVGVEVIVSESYRINLPAGPQIEAFHRKVDMLRKADPQRSLLAIAEQAIVEIGAYAKFAPGRLRGHR